MTVDWEGAAFGLAKPDTDAELARLRAELKEAQTVIKEARIMLGHARIFMKTRAKMTPTGVYLYDQCAGKIDQWLAKREKP